MAVSDKTFAANNGRMTILVSGFRSAIGKVAISIFPKSNAAGFPGDGKKAIETFYVDINEEKTVSVTSQELPFGEYAIALMHDQDGDGKFATFFGIPKDGFGFSKNPRILFGAPKYEACSFELNQSNVEVPIKMKYLL